MSGKNLTGVVGGPELSVIFRPLRVLPHANFVLWSSSFTVDNARTLRRLIREKMKNCRRLKLKLFPSVGCYRLVSRDDLRNVLRYLSKPIDLASAYCTAAGIANYAPAEMAILNGEMNRLLRNLPIAFFRVRRIERHGACHGGSRGYFGHRTPERNARRERESQRQRALRERRGHGVRPRSGRSHSSGRASPGRFRHWLQAVQPPPPPPLQQ